MFSNPEKNIAEFGFMPRQTVVDLGSGAGHYSLILSKLVGEKGHVYCVDINPDMLVRLKNQAEEEQLHNLEFILGDIEKPNGTKLKDNLADGAILSNVLSLVRDRPTAILEAKRIVKPGGKFCVVEWANRLDEATLKEMFTHAGLIFERVFDAGEEHYGFIFKK